MKPIDTRRPSRLDLNAPLLSARRSNLTAMSKIEVKSRAKSLNGSCDRVPFMWEQSPGKPKDNTTLENNALEMKALPLPKPPPLRWLQERPTSATHNVVHRDSNNEEDEDEEEEDDDCDFSDTIDLLSLAESLNTSSERLDDDNVREDYNFESDFDENNGSLSPSFMIQKFLPAATALAASSLSALAGNKDAIVSNKPLIMPMYASTNIIISSNSKNNNNNSTKEGPCMPRVAGEAYGSTKGCGLEMLFPWRVKHRVCGVKSPVRRACLKPKLSPRK